MLGLGEFGRSRRTGIPPGYVAKRSPWMSRCLRWQVPMARVPTVTSGHYLLPHAETYICKLQCDPDLPHCVPSHNHLEKWEEVHCRSGLALNTKIHSEQVGNSRCCSGQPQRSHKTYESASLPQWSGHTIRTPPAVAILFWYIGQYRLAMQWLWFRRWGQMTICHYSCHEWAQTFLCGLYSVWMSKSPSCSLSLPAITHIDCLCTYAKILPWRRWSGQLQRFRKTEDNSLSHDAAVLLITEQEHIDKNALLVWTGPWAFDSKCSCHCTDFHWNYTAWKGGNQLIHLRCNRHYE